MKKFINISTFVLGGLLTVLSLFSVASIIYALTQGVEIFGSMIKGIISIALVLASGLALLIVKKDYSSTKFWVILGVSALIVALDRFLFYGVMGFGSAIFNAIVQGTAEYIEIVFSVLLILTAIYLSLLLFLSVMEKYTAKPQTKGKYKKK